MASLPWNQHLLLRLAAVSILFALSASARPCKTFYISSFSFSIKPLYPNPNPNPNPDHPFPFQFRRGYVAFVTQITHPQPQHHHHQLQDDAIFLPTTTAVDLRKRPPLPFGLASSSSSSSSSSYYDMSSLRDRTKDILSVVVALLFGVGCGALTAATMYLFWSLFSGSPSSYRHLRLGLADDEDSGSDGSDNDDDNINNNPKKMGYVKIPEPDSFTKPVPIKETV